MYLCLLCAQVFIYYSSYYDTHKFLFYGFHISKERQGHCGIECNEVADKLARGGGLYSL